MASLNKSPLGKATGALGDVAFRQRPGNNVIALRPAHYNMPMDTKSQSRRQRFAIAARFSNAVYSITSLQPFWKSETPPGITSVNLILQKNIRLFDGTELSKLNTLTPTLGFRVKVNTISVGSVSVDVALDALGTIPEIDTGRETQVQLASVLYLSHPAMTMLDQYDFLPIVSVPQQLSLSDPLSFSIVLSSQASEMVSNYQNKLAYFVLVTLDQDSVPVHYSSTFTQ